MISDLFAALISSVILAIITFETFEKWYLKLSSTNIGVIVVILFFLNITAVEKDEIMDRIYLMGKNVTSLDDVTNDMTVGKLKLKCGNQKVIENVFRRRNQTQH